MKKKRRRRVDYSEVEFASGLSAEQAVLKVRVRGQWVPVHLSDSGRFSATFGASYESADTLVELRERLLRASRRRSVKVRIPAMVQGQGAFVPVFLTGLHAGTNALMYDYAEPRAGGAARGSMTDRHFMHDRVYRRMTSDEQAKYFELEKAKDKAEAAFERFRRLLVIDAWKLTAEAVGAATDRLEREEREE